MSFLIVDLEAKYTIHFRWLSVARIQIIQDINMFWFSSSDLIRWKLLCLSGCREIYLFGTFGKHIVRFIKIHQCINRDHFGRGDGGHGPQILKMAPIFFLTGGRYGPHSLKMAAKYFGRGP